MGDFDQLQRKLDRLGAQFDGRALRQITTRVALEAKKDAQHAARMDAGSDQRMSNWRRVRLDAGFEVRGDGVAEIKPRPSGPWKVLSEGARAHTVAPRRRGGKRAIFTPYGPRASARIPATRGKGTWRRASDRIGKETPGRVHREVERALREVF